MVSKLAVPVIVFGRVWRELFTDLDIPLGSPEQGDGLRWLLTCDSCVCFQCRALCRGELVKVELFGHGGCNSLVAAVSCQGRKDNLWVESTPPSIPPSAESGCGVMHEDNVYVVDIYCVQARSGD